MRLYGYFDGACAPVNPGGTASWGYVIYKDKERVADGSGIVGSGDGMTCNVAEAVALTRLLEHILNTFPEATEVFIHGDSNIMIRQMNGRGKKDPQGDYVPYLQMAHRAARQLRARCFTAFTWIPREENAEADYLSKQP